MLSKTEQRRRNVKDATDLMSDPTLVAGLVLTPKEQLIYNAIVDECFTSNGCTHYAILSRMHTEGNYPEVTSRSLSSILTNLVKKKVASFDHDSRGRITRLYFMQKLGVTFEPTYGNALMDKVSWEKVWEPITLDMMKRHLKEN